MTLEEIENELKSLRAQEQARQKNWRPIRRGARFIAIVYLLGAVGLLVFSIIHPTNAMSHLLFTILILASLTMSFLANALRDPTDSN